MEKAHQLEPQWLRQLKRSWRSFYKNIIIKRKFKSYWTSFIDPEYRNQIKHIYEITKLTRHSNLMMIPTHLLVHGHKIIYLEYATALMKDDKSNLEPIRVFEYEGKFVVIDGNHRLPAILSRAERFGTTMTYCEVIS